MNNISLPLHALRALLLAIYIMVGGAAMQAQVAVKQTVDSLEMVMGQQATLRLEVTLPRTAVAEWPALKEQQTLEGGLEVVGQEPDDTVALADGLVRVARRYRLTAFEPKVYHVPALAVTVAGRAYKGQEGALKVTGVEVDTAHIDHFYPPHGVQQPPFQWHEWSPVFWMSVLLVALVMVAGYVWWRRRQGRPVVVRLRKVRHVAPHDEAMERIDRIKRHHPTGLESQKEYYTALTDTLRAYIARRYGFSAREMTTDEIIARLSEEGSQEVVDELRHLLITADLVKFARHEALLDEADQSLLTAVRFVDQTKTSEQTTERLEVPPLSATDESRRRHRLWATAALVLLAAGIVATLAYVLYELATIMGI